VWGLRPHAGVLPLHPVPIRLALAITKQKQPENSDRIYTTATLKSLLKLDSKHKY
jgi:hypothetical protein